jgi:hypothetical protein
MVNLLPKLHELTREDRDNIARAMRGYKPESGVDYTNLCVIGLLDRERVAVALQVLGTTAALRLACKLLKP